MTHPSTHKPLLLIVSQWLSAIFSPLLVPTYACALALWITPLAVVSERVRLTVSLLVFGITAIVPLGMILFMMRTGKVSDPAISNRRERDVPYMVACVCYAATAIALGYIRAPHWLSFFYAGATFAVLLAVVINTRWKISAHSTTMGGLAAMTFFIAFNHYGVVSMLPWITAVMLVSGAVCSARLYMRRHSAAQVYAGFLMGLVVEYVFMTL